MSTERWQQLEDVFHAALDRAPADREAFVAAACGGDAGLRQEVEGLLRAHEQASRFVAQAAVDLERVAATVPVERQIGAYRIVRELGRGGMGTVYLGERAD
jgi:serine/threonine protein kinase